MEKLKQSIPIENRLIGEGVVTGLAIAGPGAFISAPVKGATLAAKIGIASKQFAIGSTINFSSQLIANKGNINKVDAADILSSGISNLVTKNLNANIIVDAGLSSAIDLTLTDGLKTVFNEKKEELDFLEDFGTGVTLGFIGKGSDALTGELLDSDRVRAALKGVQPLFKKGIQESVKFSEGEGFKKLKENLEKKVKKVKTQTNE